MNDVIEIKGKTSGPRVLISAGVHGDEYEPMLAALELSQRLANRLDCGSVAIASTVNESAYHAGSRYGSDGLDLARICPGRAMGTPSEEAAARISMLIRSADYYIDLHTGGTLFSIYPLAGYMLHGSPDVLARQQEMAIAFGLPVVWGSDPLPPGRTLSVARDAGVPAIYVEYGGPGPVRPEVVRAYVEGCTNVLSLLGLLPGRADRDAHSLYWVEDHTPDGAYLQAKMPSPAEGIFIPEVREGDQILKGQRWGTVTDPTTGHRHEAFADTDGLVLLVRAAPFVRKSESLGGVLPITEPGKQVIHGK